MQPEHKGMGQPTSGGDVRLKCDSSASRATLAGVGDFQIPRHCTTNDPYGGFELQRCVGEAMGWRIAMNTSASTIRAATCVLAQLHRQRVIDDCHLAAHDVGALIVATHYGGRTGPEEEDDLAATTLLLVPHCRPFDCSDGCMHAVMTSLIGVALRRLDGPSHDGVATPTSTASARDSLAPIFSSACGREARTASFSGNQHPLAPDFRSRYDYSCVHGLGHGLGHAVSADDCV
jgi:hypothetical protein